MALAGDSLVINGSLLAGGPTGWTGTEGGFGPDGGFTGIIGGFSGPPPVLEATLMEPTT
jgi:hypothetical protein